MSLVPFKNTKNEAWNVKHARLCSKTFPGIWITRRCRATWRTLRIVVKPLVSMNKFFPGALFILWLGTWVEHVFLKFLFNSVSLPAMVGCCRAVSLIVSSILPICIVIEFRREIGHEKEQMWIWLHVVQLWCRLRVHHTGVVVLRF